MDRRQLLSALWLRVGFVGQTITCPACQSGNAVDAGPLVTGTEMLMGVTVYPDCPIFVCRRCGNLYSLPREEAPAGVKGSL